MEYRSVSLAIGQNFVVADDDFTVAEDSIDNAGCVSQR